MQNKQTGSRTYKNRVSSVRNRRLAAASLSAIATLALFDTGTTLGTTYAWKPASGSTSWTTLTNWSPTYPTAGGPGAADTAEFDGSDTTNPAIASGQAINSMFFANFAAAHTFSGGPLDVTSGGSIYAGTGANYALNSETFSCPIVIEGAAYTFNNAQGSGSSIFTFSGNISGGVTGSSVLTLTGASTGTGTNVISGFIGNGSATSLGLTKSGTGTWLLSNANSNFSGGVTLSAGTLQVSASSTPTSGIVTSGPLGTGAINLSGGTLMSSGSAISIANAISLTAGTTSYVSDNSSGDLNLYGNVSGGSTSTLAISANYSDSIQFNGSFGSAFTGTLAFNDYSGGANVRLSGNANNFSSATFNLTGNTSGRAIFSTNASSSTIIQIGALNGSGGVLGGISGTYGSAATYQIGALSSTTTFTGVINNPTTGANSLSLVGTGSLTLGGPNTYSGSTNISSGALIAGINSNSTTGALGVSSAVTLGNTASALLSLNNFNVSIGSLTGGGATGGNINLGSGTLTVGADGTSPAAYAGIISGTGGLIKLGSGKLSLSGVSSYSGATNISAGTLSLLNGTLGNTAITIGSSATLQVTGSSTLGNASTGSLAVSGGKVDLRDSSINTFNTSGNLTVSNGSTFYFDIFNSSSDSINANGSASIGGSNIINLNALTSIPAGTTNYTLLTSTAGGLANAASNFSIGSKAVGQFVKYTLSDPNTNSLVLTTVSAGGSGAPPTAYWTGAGSATGGDTANNWGYGAGLATPQSNFSSDSAGMNDTLAVPGPNTNVIFTASNATSVGGVLNTTLDAPYSIASLYFNTSNATTPITSVGINTSGNTLTIGAGGLTIDAANTSTITISGTGPVVVGGSQTWSNNTSLPLNISAGINGNASAGTITLNVSGPTNISGPIGDGTAGGTLSLTVLGGTTTLLSPNTYTGTTNISSGSLIVGASGSLSSSTAVIVGSSATAVFNQSSQTIATLNGNGPLLLNGTALTVSNGGSFNGAIGSGGSGSLTVSAGTLILGGSNTYTGATTVTSGILTVTGNELSATGSYNVGTTDANNCTVNLNNGSSIAVASGNTIQVGSTGAGFGLEILNVAGNVNNSGTLYAGRDALVNINSGGVWNQSGGISVVGNGGYGSVMTVNTGAIFNYNGSSAIALNDVSGSNAAGSSTLAVAGGTFNTTQAFTETNGAGGGIATIILSSGGTLGLSANISQLITGTGSTGANTKPLQLGNGSGGVINTNGFNTSIASAIINISGQAGALTITGGGTVTLTGANNYSGGTSIIGGTLLAGAVNTLSPNSAFNVAGGTLDVSGYNQSIAGLTVAPGATLNLGFGNVLTDTGAVSYGGTLNLLNISNTTITSSNLPYELMSYNNSAGRSGTFTAVNGVPSGDVLSYSLVAGELVLTSAGPNSLIWNNSGGGDGTTWNASSSQLNWLNGTTPTGYSDTSNSSVGLGDVVTFNDSNNGNYNVSIPATVHPTSVTVSTNSSTGYTFSGAGGIAGAGGLTKLGSGLLTISTSNSFTGGTNISAGTVAFTVPGAFPTFTSLTIGSGAFGVAVNHSTGLTGSSKNNLFVSSLSLTGSTGAWTGQLDLGNNDMIVKVGASTSLATINNQVAQGYNNGNWNGPGGIVSSAAANDTTHLTALGVILNDDGTGSGHAIYSTFDGAPTGEGDVLVKYTFYGDANLNGAVDGSDYSRIDNAYLNNLNSSNPQLTGWFNGDFNYDGVINGSDYTLIDNAFNTQGAQISDLIAGPEAIATAQIAGTSAVPEPATIGLLGIGAVGLLGRRSRRRI
jgi:fibronectin-binding autotransporter adhesin